MPATSNAQRTLFRIALSIKKGETPRSYSKKAAELADSMSLEELEKYAKEPIKKK
jgi:hypothetical protein